MTGGEVKLERLVKRYSELVAVDRVSLSIRAGEFLTLLGASGSGKTTTLMMVAGFVEPDEGQILIDGRSMLHMPPERRGLGVVFQSYALFPHLDVFENVAFPLRMRRAGKADIERKVRRALEMVDLGALAHRRIPQLSGGQQQRVALARALVFEPPVLLMDEPLGALDRKLREQLQREIKRIQLELGITVIYVTHDQEEALVLSDRIAIMAKGAIEQLGTPREVYERPESAFVADFLGDSNFLEVTIEGVEEGAVVLRPAGDGDCRLFAQANGRTPTGAVRAMIRPESVRLLTTGEDAENSVVGRITTKEFLGASVRMSAATPYGPIDLRVQRTAAAGNVGVGEEIRLGWARDEMVVFER